MQANPKRTIFVQIASYRDKELVDTLRDCITKADDSQNLVFSIAWQRCESEKKLVSPQLDELSQQAILKIKEFDWRESQGACWARYQLQQAYQGEAYTLHLDAHHRFKKGWDRRIIEEHDALHVGDVSKPIISGYLNAFVPYRHRAHYRASKHIASADLSGLLCAPEKSVTHLPQKNLKLHVRGFTNVGIPMVGSFEVSDEHFAETALTPSGLYSGHFCFAPGSMVEEVPHDPELYFIGEEITLGLRAFSHGYDCFDPQQNLCWHEYLRDHDSNKHWNDHDETHLPDQANWVQREQISQTRCLSLFEVNPKPVELGQFGLGNARDLIDFRRLTGLDFQRRGIVNADGALEYKVSIVTGSHLFADHQKDQVDLIQGLICNEVNGLVHRHDALPESHPEIWEQTDHDYEISFISPEPPKLLHIAARLKDGTWLKAHTQQLWF